jgi:hypothetical protein
VAVRKNHDGNFVVNAEVLHASQAVGTREEKEKVNSSRETRVHRASAMRTATLDGRFLSGRRWA